MTLKILRRVGVAAIVATGAVHLVEYLGDYHSVPTIGPLFLLNAIGAGVIALGLLMPLERRLSQRRGELAVGLLALGGVALAVGSLIGLYISETSTLFGFAEGPLDAPMWIAIVAEVTAAIALAPVAMARLARTSSQHGRTRSTGALSSG